MSDRSAWARRLGVADLARTNKYHARAIVVDGIRFDSRKEATRYRELVILQAAGMVRDLTCHPSYEISVVELWRGDPERTATQPYRFGPVVLCGRYTADFRYVVVSSGEVVIEDTKCRATKTEAYRLRKRLVETIHGIRIREV